MPVNKNGSACEGVKSQLAGVADWRQNGLGLAVRAGSGIDTWMVSTYYQNMSLFFNFFDMFFLKGYGNAF